MVISSFGIPDLPGWEDTLPGTPARAGKRPVSMPALDAEQIADGEYICVNRIPVFANISCAGVTRSLEP